MKGLDNLKKFLNTLLLFVFVIAFGYFFNTYKIATTNIGNFEEKSLLYDQQDSTFFVEHMGEQVEVKIVKDIFNLDVDKTPDMKVYYFKHNIEDDKFFCSGIEIFSGEYTPEELRTFVLKHKRLEFIFNCFLTCVFAFCFYVLCTLVYIVISDKFVLKN